MKLAMALGKDLSEVAKMTSLELSYWKAYYELDPFDEERADLRSAIVASTVSAGIPSKKKRKVKVSDFMPKFGDAAKSKPNKQTAKEQQLIAKQITAMLSKPKGAK